MTASGGTGDETSDEAEDVAALRTYLLDEHRPVWEATLDCANALAEAGTIDADQFETVLRERGVVEALPSVLTGAVRELGATLPARPVAASPYVVVTRAGPVARATLPERGRLVVTVAAFERRDGEWVRAGATPEDALTVELR